MNLLYFGLGVVCIAVAIGDLLWTTLWVEGGAGPMTTRLMSWTWLALRRTAERHSRALSLVGPLVLVLTLLGWLVLLWAGWTLVFASAERALVDTLNRGRISWADRVYFTGYTLFTLGIGDFVPRTGVWRIATALATGGGMLFVTLSVTYVLSVLDAVSQKRAFASNVTGLGMGGEDVLRSAWNGEDFSSLDLPLNSFVSELNTLTANHKAYPILHYFHSENPRQAAPVSIAILEDALTALRFGVPEDDRPNVAIVANARSSIGGYLDTLESTIQSADHTPPPPDIDALEETGIPTVSPDEFSESLEELADRRRKLRAVVEDDARQWPSSDDT
jgi:hypothetical protein